MKNMYGTPLIEIHYTIHSGLETMDETRFNQKITGEIVHVDEKGNHVEVVGRIVANKLLLEEARKLEWQGASIFFADEITSNIGSWIYDCEKEVWTTPIIDYYNGNLSGDAVLILSHIEIIPAYRRIGIGILAIKDLYNNFIQGAALFALKCSPIESESNIPAVVNKPPTIMKYHGREQGYSKGFIKLHTYFKTVGFETIPMFDDEIMLINPQALTERFDEIFLD